MEHKANLMVILFGPPWRIPNVHNKSLFEKKDFVGFWTNGMGHWNPSHD
jgi:hypothetical protein